MKLLIETVIIFFGTLLAAALVALGGPASVELVTHHAGSAQSESDILVSTPAYATQETAHPRR
jgi:hypothetical protein